MQEFQNSVHWNVIYVEPREWITCKYKLLNSNLGGFSDVKLEHHVPLYLPYEMTFESWSMLNLR
jgi:hypothetical protein